MMSVQFSSVHNNCKPSSHLLRVGGGMPLGTIEGLAKRAGQRSGKLFHIVVDEDGKIWALEYDNVFAKVVGTHNRKIDLSGCQDNADILNALS